jgi:hypothetical protein
VAKEDPGKIVRLPEGDPALAAALRRIDELESLVSKLNTTGAGEVENEVSEKKRAWLNLSAQEKTQLVIDQRWGTDGKRWRVNLTGHPEVLIPAESREEAISRYNLICGITAVVDNDPQRPLRHAVAAA